MYAKQMYGAEWKTCPRYCNRQKNDDCMYGHT